MEKIFKYIINKMEKGNDIVLITIIAGSGSTPRGAGARMVAASDGTFIGTVGGGAIEYRSQKIATEILDNKKSQEKAFKLDKDDVANLGMICGGDVVIYFQYIDHSDLQVVDICKKVITQIKTNEDTWLIMDISGFMVNNMGLYSKNAGFMNITDHSVKALLQSKAYQVDHNGCRYYIEQIVRSGKVYIFGCGHIAQELVPILSHVGFKCTVFDDRESFACRELFPDAYEIIVGDCNNIFEKVSFTENDYVAIMTRGHQHDYLIQKQMLSTKVPYIGVMGSRKKMEGIAQKFVEEGYKLEDIKRFTSPIGTSIMAETPAEIAISIAGELIYERAKRYE